MAVRERFEHLRSQALERLSVQYSPDCVQIQVGSATCENAAGAHDVRDEFVKHIRATGRTDIVVRQTGCTGRCSCEPIVGILVPGRMPVRYQRVDRAKAHEIFTRHVLAGEAVRELLPDGVTAGLHRYDFFVCGATRCGRFHQTRVAELLRAKLCAAGIDEQAVSVIETNCFGLCGADELGSATHLLVRPGKTVYRIAQEADLDRIVEEHVQHDRVVESLRVTAQPVSAGFFELYGDAAFFNLQTRVALRNSGVIDPENVDEYLARQGFTALADALERGDPEWVIAQIAASKLRGRGGGGYPTGVKWADARRQPGDAKYVICNADEGDPGAFMDRSMLEGDPFSVLEGMLLAGYAIGAQRGFFYVRAEYPLAVRRVESALRQAREQRLLGDDILGSGFAFDAEIRLGAGAFVCGEETALINSIQGERGQPRIRPPYPTQSGLWGRPTVINNVETLANVPAVLQYGPGWFRQIGTAESGGTKVFALAGKVQHTGLVEVPMGSTLREIVCHIGGGPPAGKQLKAIQTGGPAGGCIKADFLDTPVDFDTLMQAGSIMGSGGMIVMDEDDCIVDIAKFFLTFSRHESCGKCTPCREGTQRMLEILARITSGQGTPADLARLARLAELVRKSSLCGLGRAAPNPVLSTLRHFRAEYDAHVLEKRCPARRCAALIHYEIDEQQCVGCMVCARNCPVTCIQGERRQPHVIDQVRCVKCGRCFEVCRFAAVNRQ